MKLNFKLGTRRPLTRAEAWGCVTANLALPGSGSLAAGRAVGYFQMALTIIGFVLTIIGGAAFVQWYAHHLEQISQAQGDDPYGALLLLWQAGRWAFLGVAIFIFDLIWSALTGFQIMQERRADSVPPRIEK